MVYALVSGLLSWLGAFDGKQYTIKHSVNLVNNEMLVVNKFLNFESPHLYIIGFKPSNSVRTSQKMKVSRGHSRKNSCSCIKLIKNLRRRLTFQTIQLLSVCVEFSVDIQQTSELTSKKKEPGKQK